MMIKSRVVKLLVALICFGMVDFAVPMQDHNAEAGRSLQSVVKQEVQIKNDSVADAAPLFNAPLWNREVPKNPARPRLVNIGDSSRSDSGLLVPVLLYHHIGGVASNGRYRVPGDIFAQQLRNLVAWGYQAVTVSELSAALQGLSTLPEHPVVFTFDDGYQDVFQYAYPLMQRYGMVGTVYLISGQVGVGGYLDHAEIQTLLDAGWEIGSHSRSHASLRQVGVDLRAELEGSKADLESWFGVPVRTFAYPYGLTSPWATRLVRQAGYQAALGLGGGTFHKPGNRYYLSRIEVRGNYRLDEFASLLPWKGPIIYPHAIRNLSRVELQFLLIP